MRLGRGGDSDGVHFPVSRFAMCIVFYLHLHLHGSQTCNKDFNFNHRQKTKKKKKGKKDYAYITRLGLGWESEFSGLQIHGIRRRFYSNDNILMRYAQRYIMSRDG